MIYRISKFYVKDRTAFVEYIWAPDGRSYYYQYNDFDFNLYRLFFQEETDDERNMIESKMKFNGMVSLTKEKFDEKVRDIICIEH